MSVCIMERKNKQRGKHHHFRGEVWFKSGDAIKGMTEDVDVLLGGD